MIKVQNLTGFGVVPKRGSAHSAGLDLYSVDHGEIQPGGRQLIKTGIAISIPHGFFGSIRPRSGLALNCGIDTMAGVIDSDYTGEIGVILINHSDYLFSYDSGDKIAQLVIQPHHSDFAIEVVDSLESTGRGGRGFGSTGA
jgi:dUTP pyrophosphatase